MSFADALLAWHDRHGRRHLPWQTDRSPYRVWVSEIMLQQTQVAAVIPYFARFTGRLPTLPDLAACPHDELMALWSGLGYYARARNLKRAAGLCVERHGGRLPLSFEALVSLPGIGRSTAGAILALADDQRFPILDGNVKRVLARYHAVEGWPGRSVVQRRLWSLAEGHMPYARIADYTQAMMDLGATLCTPRQPACGRCPVARDCQARERGDPTRFPEARPKKALPERHRFTLLLADGDGLWLERRPPEGIWGGLHAPPLVETLDEVGASHPLSAPVRHTFTHFRLVMTPVLVEQGAGHLADRDLRRVTRDDLGTIGLPQPVARLLEDYFKGELPWQEQFIA